VLLVPDPTVDYTTGTRQDDGMAGAPQAVSRRRCAALVIAALSLAAASLASGGTAAAARPAAATASTADAPTTKGTALVARFFDLLKAGDTKGLDQFLSTAFLLQGADGGVLDKASFVANPSKVASYDLTDVRVTRTGNVLVARYDVAATITINGVPQARAPAPRLSVFVKGAKGWQMVAHANFNVAA
jgi:uncharacterized protein DUF4440